jgi:hypothetical protein
MCGAAPAQAGERYGSMNYDPSTVTSAQRMWIRHHSGVEPINDREKLKTLYNIINQRG